MFWADELAKKIIGERNQDNYLVTDTKTPSGRVHVGALEGVLYHYVIAKSIEKFGKTAMFQYGFDDYDTMDSLPVYVPKEYEKYMGVSLSEIPALEGNGSFADFFANEFIGVFNSLGVMPSIVYTSKMYKNGEFNKAILIAINKAESVRNIYKKIINQDRPADWLPIQMLCEKCGKIGTTRAYAWDGEQISYKCEEDWVKYTKGCGHSGKRSPLNGNSKLPWKVEWAAKWFIWNSDVEGAGKDHMTKNGSHDAAVAFAREIYNIKEPESFRYEFFLIDGKKMSSSKGLGSSAKEVCMALPLEILRFLIINSKPNTQINFKLSGQSLIKLFNEYDMAFIEHKKKSDSDSAKAFEYSLTSEVPNYLMRFGKVVSLVQIPHINIVDVAKEEYGKELNTIDEKELNQRISYAKYYLEHLADDDEKFELQEKMPDVSLGNTHKKLLTKISDFIENDMDPEKIHNFIYETGKELGLKPKDTFEVIYKIFLDKTSGPKAGWFLANLDKDFVVRRLNDAANI